MWGVEGTRKTEADRLLAAALTEYEASSCSGCGEPKHTAWDPDRQGYYDVRCDVVCGGCGALHEARKHDHKDEPGVKHYLVWEPAPDR